MVVGVCRNGSRTALKAFQYLIIEYPLLKFETVKSVLIEQTLSSLLDTRSRLPLNSRQEEWSFELNNYMAALKTIVI